MRYWSPNRGDANVHISERWYVANTPQPYRNSSKTRRKPRYGQKQEYTPMKAKREQLRNDQKKSCHLSTLIKNKYIHKANFETYSKLPHSMKLSYRRSNRKCRSKHIKLDYHPTHCGSKKAGRTKLSWPQYW